MSADETDVLGIGVPVTLLARWRGWLMPAEQPFLVPEDKASALGLPSDPARLTFELTDSFWLYDLDGQAVCWLSRASSHRLPGTVRQTQPAPHRWPSADASRDGERVIRFVERGRRPSRHRQVDGATWDRVRALLPGARELAGTFPAGSGPNCFGSVMAAAGVSGAADAWMQRGPFEQWLAAATTPGGDDGSLGTVLVWRDAEQDVQHAAVTLGDGWALHKPSQGWMSPVKVLTVHDAMSSARQRGHHVHRHRIRS